MPVVNQIFKELTFMQMANESINLEGSTNSSLKAMTTENSTRNYEETSSNIALDNNSIVNNNTSNNNSNTSISTPQPNSSGRDRKGTSYVWNYCEKLSRHTVRCRLCTKIMSFHGTANIITHLQRRHNILGDNIIQTSFPLSRRATRADEMMDGNGPGGSGTFDPMMMTDLMDDVTEENDRLNADKYNNSLGNNRKSINSASVVWRYCRRISKDQVRCCFCKKDLSYQGTSNLQRHLHRMHGVVTQGRHPKMNTANNQDNGIVHTAVDDGGGDGNGNSSSGGGGGGSSAGHIYYPVIKEENVKLPNNLDFIWQFCTHHEVLPKVKCNMCELSFLAKDMMGIAKHLTMIHGVEVNHLVQNANHLHDSIELCGQSKWRHRHALDFENSNDDNYYDFSGLNKWNKIVNEKDEDGSHQKQLRNSALYGENNMKKDDSLFYDELIEEDREDHYQGSRYDEEPFDPSILENLPEINPLSVRSSCGSHSPDGSERITHTAGVFSARLPYGHFPVSIDPQLLKLQKDCLRMETEYFREKAGYFRMQKHLTALQAKKIRLELERLNQSIPN